MSTYTTGEVAKLCGVTVRTVQYYDNRGILIPSDLSEGGRRLYSEKDLQKMKIICFLRELDMPIKSIGELLSEEAPENVISILLDQQESELREEIAELRERLQKLEALQKGLKGVSKPSVESIGDVALIMKNRKKMFWLRVKMTIVGVLIEALEIATIAVWIAMGAWLPFVLALPVIIGGAVWSSVDYFQNVAYICPSCHDVFRPRLKDAFFASHTPTTRKLTCPCCGHKGFCVETYGKGIPSNREKSET